MNHVYRSHLIASGSFDGLLNTLHSNTIMEHGSVPRPPDSNSGSVWSSGADYCFWSVPGIEVSVTGSIINEKEDILLHLW